MALPPWSTILRPPAHAFTAVHRQRDAGHEPRLVGVQVERGVRHVPARAHPAPQRQAPVARGVTSSRGVPLATRASMAIGVFISPGRIELARTPYCALAAARFSVSATTAALVVL